MAGLFSVKDIMIKDVKRVRTDTSVQEVVATMAKYDISSVVVAQKDKPVGLITHKDLLTKVLQSRIPPADLVAREVMSTSLVTVKEETSLEEAAKLMARKGLKKLIVVRNDKLVGIITSMDIIKAEPKLVGLLEDLLKSCASKPGKA
jgi:CBS domain-containing protein